MTDVSEPSVARTAPCVTGRVFDVQRFSLHDGPGIRTVVFLKGCPLRCAWCANPESQQPGPQIAWFENLCAGCGRCAEACPNGAIRMDDGRPRTDRRLCAACGECAAACSRGARRLMGREVTVDEVMAEVRRDAPFFRRSGGGVTFSGGEPLAQPAVPARVPAALPPLGLPHRRGDLRARALGRPARGGARSPTSSSTTSRRSIRPGTRS